MTVSNGADRWTNSAQTTLSGNGGSITAGATSMKVASALAFPSTSTAFYRVLVDNEIMQITGGQGTTTWTILRGLEGTAAASHNDGATVTHDISAFELNSFRQEFNVIAYGAVGDGVADESTAFQNAINDAHAQTVGGVVFLPTLTFKVLSTLTTYSNVVFVTYGATITGAGASSVAPLIKWSLTGGLTLPGALSGTNGLTISGGLTISSGGLTITGGGSITGNLTLTGSQTSGQVALTIAPAAVGTVTAETTILSESAQTLTITSGYTTQRFNVFNAPTITAASALTITNAATLAIAGAPIAGGSAVLTSSWALWVQSGITRLDSTLDLSATGNVIRGTGLASGGTVLSITPPNVGTVVAETFDLSVAANTLTITSGYTTQRFNVFQAPTISAGSALTVTNAATLAIAGAPAVGGSAVITNPYAFWVQAGLTKIDGGLNLAANASNTVPTIPSAAGAKVWIQAGDPGGSASNGDVWFAA